MVEPLALVMHLPIIVQVKLLQLLLQRTQLLDQPLQLIILLILQILLLPNTRNNFLHILTASLRKHPLKAAIFTPQLLNPVLPF
jgi:hypothetical protein